MEHVIIQILIESVIVLNLSMCKHPKYHIYTNLYLFLTLLLWQNTGM